MKSVVQYSMKVFVLYVALASVDARAAEMHLGLQSGAQGLIPGLSNGASQYLPYAGAQISSTWSLQNDWVVRPGLEGNLFFLPDTPFFFARADVTLLNKANPLYWGIGLGTGSVVEDLTEPRHIPSYLALTNVHGVLGRDFGHHEMEAMVRVGMLSSVGVRLRIKGP